MHQQAVKGMVSPLCVSFVWVHFYTLKCIMQTAIYLFCSFHKGGSLASIEDPPEQEFIQKHLKVFQDSHSFFWIGLYKTNKGTVQ